MAEFGDVTPPRGCDVDDAYGNAALPGVGGAMAMDMEGVGGGVVDDVVGDVVDVVVDVTFPEGALRTN